MRPEPTELTCSVCKKTKPFRRPANNKANGRIQFPGYKRGLKDSPVCDACCAAHYDRYNRAQGAAEAARLRNRDTCPATEAYVIYKRDKIPRKRRGTDTDRCLRFTAKAVYRLDAKLESLDVKEWHDRVAVKAVFRAPVKPSEALFRKYCIEAMEADR